MVDSGASVHMLSKKDLTSDELDTLRTSRNPTTVVTANGEVQTNEEAQVYVHDLHLFVSVHILDDTLADLSLGKLCEEHGYTSEWASSQKPRMTEEGEETFLYSGKLRASCCSWIVKVWVPVRPSTSPSQARQVHTSPSPAGVRSDEEAPANQRDPKKNNKEAVGNPLARPPGVVEELTENLEDKEVPASRDTSAKHFSGLRFRTSYESGIQQAQYFFSLHPKHRNCEI